MSHFRTLDDFDPRGKVVLLRADLNVPTQDGHVSDATRITRLLPTITALTKSGARVVILSHFGRPKGRDGALSLRPIAQALETALGHAVAFADDCIGDVARAAVASVGNGEVLVLENVRFYDEEEKNDPAFAAKIAALGDVYVNDAFSAAHRAHATTQGLARILPAYAGKLMEAELKALEAALGNPQRPVAAVVGGAKVSTKLDLLNNLVARIDLLILGGGMANTFLHAQGIDVAASLCERERAQDAREILRQAESKGCRVLLPVDAVVAREFKSHTATQTVSVSAVPAGTMILDVGPKTISAITDALAGMKTLVWNGPLGAFETPPFEAGTVAIARAVAALTAQKKLMSVAGGGDTVAALALAGVEDKLSYVSAAGGAFLEWMEGKTLPGVAALAV